MKTAYIIFVAALAVFGAGAGAQAQTIDDLKPPIVFSDAQLDARMDEVDALLEKAHALLEKARDSGDQGVMTEAVATFEKALSVSETYLGEGPYTVAVLNNVAFAYVVAGQNEKSERAYIRAIYIQSILTRSDDPDLMMTYANLGSVYVLSGKLPDAEGAYLNAVRCSENVTGEERENIPEMLRNFADLYVQMGRPAEADALRVRADAMK